MVLHIHEKELLDDQHSCARSQLVFLSVLVAQIPSLVKAKKA